MRTALMTHVWPESDENMLRTRRWIDAHGGVADRLGWHRFALLNGAHWKDLQLRDRFHCAIPLYRQLIRDGILGYPYTWRAFYFLKTFMDIWDFDKIVYMENDFFVRSGRMLKWIEEITDGKLATVWCKKYGFPESAFFVLTRGCPRYENYIKSGDWMEHCGELIECALPWTEIHTGMIGDRYEDIGSTPKSDVDFTAQQLLSEELPQWMT